MNSSQIFGLIDSIIATFMSFARGVLGPIAILCSFFAGVKMVIVILPFLAAFIPAFFIKGDVLPLAATAIACAMAGKA